MDGVRSRLRCVVPADMEKISTVAGEPEEDVSPGARGDLERRSPEVPRLIPRMGLWDYRFASAAYGVNCR